MLEIAREICGTEGTLVRVLDLSRLASEYGRNIHPCKACFSTAAALCHWPCSCYPNYSLGQTQDWMNEIYPLWVRAHGIMLINPVNWYSPTSPMKLMMDRLVCADGGNPDPTSTHGKDAKKAKELELADWPYPRHLEGRVFSVIVHGDVEGAENVRRSLADWLRFMKLKPAGPTRRAGPLHRLLEALCDQPPGAGCGSRHPGGSAQRGPNPAARRPGATGGQADRCGRGARSGPAEVGGALVMRAFAP